MVRERLEAWTEARRVEAKVPSPAKELLANIIYYRDGVGTGQYETIKAKEVTAIRDAYRQLAADYKLPTSVKIHAVVVVKRHHTRFYPMPGGKSDNFGNNNTMPGTLVDRLVTSPYYQDFFLQSHSGIKGTVKPTHYFVLSAEISGLTLEKLRDVVRHTPSMALYPHSSANAPTDAPNLLLLCSRLMRRILRFTHILRRPPVRPWTHVHPQILRQRRRGTRSIPQGQGEGRSQG
jgi:hypothetical protein